MGTSLSTTSWSLIFAGVGVLLIILYSIFDNLFVRNHKTSNIVNGLLKHFAIRKEKVIEFRIKKDKAFGKRREFEVKTMQQKYYKVALKGLSVTDTIPIDQYTITEENWYVRGKIDPVKLDRYEIQVKE